MRYLDRALSVLLLLGAAGHTFGVVGYYRGQTDALFWALSETLLVVLLAAVNLLRTDRPQDRGLAWIATVASASYIVFSIAFGRIIAHDIFDPRTIAFGLVSLGLTLLGLRTALGKA